MMKTIKERAIEYTIDSVSALAKMNGVADMVERAFVAGAESEHKELTEWNNPNTLPDNKCINMKIFYVVYVSYLPLHGLNVNRELIKSEKDLTKSYKEVEEILKRDYGINVLVILKVVEEQGDTELH